MALKRKELKDCLIFKFGFEEVEGSKHQAVSLFYNKKKIATARFSSTHDTISEDILTRIAKQLWVNLHYLKEMKGCTKGPDNYKDCLRRQNKLKT